MKKHVRCLATWDNEGAGTFGLVPLTLMAWFEGFDTGGFLPGLQLGHDILEHSPKDDGSMEREFKALGAGVWISSFYVRYGNFMRSSESVFAGNIEGTIRDGFYNGLPTIPASKPYPNFEDKDDLWEFFNAEFDGIKDSLPRDLSLDYEYEGEGIGEETQALIDWIDSNKQAIFDWVAYGYWYASAKRYKNHDSYAVWLPREAINKLKLDHIEEGYEYTISYDLQNAHAEVKAHRRRNDW